LGSAKVTQQMVIDAHSAANPHIGQISLTKSTQLTSTGNGFNRRKLQYQGHTCDPNVLDVARQDPNLSTAVMLIETAGLSDIFLLILTK